MKRRDFLKHTAAGAAVLFLPVGCAAPDDAGGAAVAGPSGQPSSMPLRSDGTLVFVDRGVTLEVDRAANQVWVQQGASRVLLGGGDAGEMAPNAPVMALLEPGTSGRIHVVDRGNGRILVFAANGALLEVRAAGQLNMPGGAVFAQDGTLFVADSLNHRVVALDAAGAVVASFGAPGSSLSFNAPAGVTLDQDGNLHVLDAGNRRVVVLDRRGNQLHSYTAASGGLRCATAITAAPDGSIYVADANGAAIHAFHPNGSQLAVLRPVLGSNRLTPLALSCDAQGALYVCGMTGAPV